MRNRTESLCSEVCGRNNGEFVSAQCRWHFVILCNESEFLQPTPNLLSSGSSLGRHYFIWTNFSDVMNPSYNWPAPWQKVIALRFLFTFFSMSNVLPPLLQQGCKSLAVAVRSKCLFCWFTGTIYLGRGWRRTTTLIQLVTVIIRRTRSVIPSSNPTSCMDICLHIAGYVDMFLMGHP